MAVRRTSFPAALEALLQVRGPGVVCHFRTMGGYGIHGRLCGLETLDSGLYAIVAVDDALADVTWMVEVAMLAEVSCDGPPGWARALP